MVSQADRAIRDAMAKLRFEVGIRHMEKQQQAKQKKSGYGGYGGGAAYGDSQKGYGATTGGKKEPSKLKSQTNTGSGYGE